MKPIAILLVALALPLARPLAAQEDAIGARVHLVIPTGDLVSLTNRQLGLGAAAFVNIPISGGFVIRPLLGFQFIPKGETVGLTGTKTTVASVDFMVDGLWYPGGDPEHGAYLIGSVGGQQWHVTASGTSPSTINTTKMGVNGGIGYQVSPRFSFEVRGFMSPIDKTITANGLMLGVTVSF